MSGLMWFTFGAAVAVVVMFLASCVLPQRERKASVLDKSLLTFWADRNEIHRQEVEALDKIAEAAETWAARYTRRKRKAEGETKEAV